MQWSPFVAALAAVGVAGTTPAPRPVLWAWERPEDLRFVGDAAEVAVQAGFVVLTGAGVYVRGRRFPVRTATPPTTVVVHVQIDRHRSLTWTAEQRREAAQAVLHFASAASALRLQVDFEVRASERHVLLDLLSDVRRGAPRGMKLSMTALASWCDGEHWLDAAPVDEVVPMLFRMGSGAQALRAKLEAGGDFADRRCRSAVGIATDTPLARVPAGRRVYVFNPHSWTAADFQAVRRERVRWSSVVD